jgi:hypothetical protein
MVILGRTGRQFVGILGRTGGQFVGILGRTGGQFVVILGRTGGQFVGILGRSGGQFVGILGNIGVLVACQEGVGRAVPRACTNKCVDSGQFSKSLYQGRKGYDNTVVDDRITQ